MKRIKSVVSALFCACLIAAVSVAGQQCSDVHVANIKSIFAIAPSPVGHSVLFYGSTNKAEGEIVSGDLFRLQMQRTDSSVVQLKSSEASNPSSPVWQPDGSFAYFETDQGIYKMSSADGSTKLLWQGPSDGISISPNGSLLAFWHVEKGTDFLVVYDLKKELKVRTWQVSDRFESDKSGWDLSFAQDGHTLYARTYDETSSTPLKRFDIISGAVAMVDPNCYAVATGKEAVYFISASGVAKSLYKIAATTSHSILVVKNFDYDSLAISGNPRWLVSQNYRTSEIAILDTERDAVKSIGKRELATVLSDGKLIVVNGSNITLGGSSCKPTKSAKESYSGGLSTTVFQSNIQEYVEKTATAAHVSSINISATTNGKYVPNSNHYGGNAIDINRVNNEPVINTGKYSSVAAAVRSIQDAANSTEAGVAHENFGPAGLYKDGKPILNNKLQAEHENYIHITVPKNAND